MVQDYSDFEKVLVGYDYRGQFMSLTHRIISHGYHINRVITS